MQLTSHNSTHPTHLTPSPHPTRLAQFNSLNTPHSAHLTQVISHNSLYSTPGTEVRAVIHCETHGAALSLSFDPTFAQTSILHLISHNSSHTPTIIHLFIHLVSQSCVPDKHGFTCGVIRSFNFSALFASFSTCLFDTVFDFIP